MYRVLHTTPRTTASTTQDTYCGNEHINLTQWRRRVCAVCVLCVRVRATIQHSHAHARTSAAPHTHTTRTRARAGICRGFATKLQKEQEAEK